MRIFEHLHVDWLGKRKIFYFISGALFLVGVINAIIRGFQFGIDFKGGTEIVLQFDKPIDVSQIRADMQGLSLGNVELKTFGTETGILIRTEQQQLPASIYPKVIRNVDTEINNILPGVPRKIVDSSVASVTYEFLNPDTTNIIASRLVSKGFQTSKESEELTNKRMIVNIGIAEWLKINLKEKIKDNPFTILREQKIGPKVGSELKRDAVIAVFLSLVAILLYLAFRYKFIFALGAVIALFHDVLITLGLYAALYGVIPGLNLEIDLTVLAAFLTLVGYSVNDTIIVFDRMRENLKIHKTMPLFDLMNMSINRTMSRTILSGGTVLMSVFVLLIFGGEVIRAFSFTIFFGIITGTYSSIFIASAFVLDYVNKSKRKITF